jgi:hypothetical protein
MCVRLSGLCVRGIGMVMVVGGMHGCGRWLWADTSSLGTPAVSIRSGLLFG